MTSWPSYADYLASAVWRKKRQSEKARARWRCQICNQRGDDTSLHAHHRTYARLGHEWKGDITVLCEDCHWLYHGQFVKPGSRRWWDELTRRLSEEFLWEFCRIDVSRFEEEQCRVHRGKKPQQRALHACKDIVTRFTSDQHSYNLAIDYVAHHLGLFADPSGWAETKSFCEDIILAEEDRNG